MIAPTTKPPAVDTEKTRSRKSDSGSSGSSTRRSIATNTTASASPARPVIRTSGEPHG